MFSPQESEFTLFISETLIPDVFLANVISHLTTYSERGGGLKEISYRDMNVRHLGTLYEGLLEHKLFITKEDTEVRVKKGKIQFIPVSKGGKLIEGQYLKQGVVYFANNSEERRTSGSFFTPEDVVEYIVSSTVEELLKSKKEDFKNSQKSNIKAYLQAINNHEREILSSLLKEELLEFIRDVVLDISVLDPSMGSGHFLINTANVISNFISETLNSLNIQENVETSTLYWRRWVVENCIYGVDINPLAVELAKLSIWILSMAKSQPLSFLNHNLKCGDSLIGCRLSDIGDYLKRQNGERTNQLSLFYEDPKFKFTVKEVIKRYQIIEGGSSSSLDEILNKKALLDEIEIRFIKFKNLCDFHVETFMNPSITNEEYIQVIKESDFTRAKKVTENRKYFNWELEYPSQMLIEGGFDVVIGNPPYADISAEFFQFYESHYESINSKDLCTLFIEKMIELNKIDGFCSFVLPLSLTYSRNMRKIRKKIMSKENKSWKVSSFDRIPDALFGGNVRTRNSILIGFPSDKKQGDLFMTPMYRWFSHERNLLFSSITYYRVNEILEYIDGWPKIGSELQVKILKKIFSKRNKLEMLFTRNKNDFPLFYSSTAYNWLTITNKMPPIFDENGYQVKQSKYGSMYFENEEQLWFCLSVMNSIFTYFFWLVYGDGFDVTKTLLGDIPLHPTMFKKDSCQLIIETGIMLQEQMEKNIVYKKNAGKNVGNYNLRFCRDITNEIDQLIIDEMGFGKAEYDDIQGFCRSMIKTKI